MPSARLAYTLTPSLWLHSTPSRAGQLAREALSLRKEILEEEGDPRGWDHGGQKADLTCSGVRAGQSWGSRQGWEITAPSWP